MTDSLLHHTCIHRSGWATSALSESMEIAAREIIPHIEYDRTYHIRNQQGAPVFSAGRRQLMALIDAKAVSAEIQTKKKQFRGISYFHLRCSERQARQIAGIGKGSKGGQHVAAEDNKTCVRDGRTYKHHPGRSAAYRRGAA